MVFNDYQGKRTGKAQPGYFAHYPPINNTEYNCDDIYKRIKKDNPSIRKTNFNNKCPKGSTTPLIIIFKYLFKRRTRIY